MRGLTAGLDPGRDKCGLAVVDEKGGCLFHQVVPTPALEKHLQRLYAEYGFSLLVMGNGVFLLLDKALERLTLLWHRRFRKYFFH